MATPRSEKGFLAAIESAQAKIKELDEKLTDAVGDEENEILSDKADAEVELATLQMKFEEFQEKASDKDDDEPEPEAEKEQAEDEPAEVEPNADDSLPEIDAVAFVKVVRGGYMVNPYTHAKFVEGAPSKSIIDTWTLSQIKAGIMEVVTE